MCLGCCVCVHLCCEIYDARAHHKFYIDVVVRFLDLTQVQLRIFGRQSESNPSGAKFQSLHDNAFDVLLVVKTFHCLDDDLKRLIQDHDARAGARCGCEEIPVSQVPLLP